MRKIGSVPILSLLVLAGCASFSGYDLVPGQATVADVQATMGKPAAIREQPGGEKVYWYPRLPFGRQSFAARIGPDGRLVAIEQRLDTAYIARIRPNVSTAEDVLDAIGPPNEVYRYARQQREVWEYQLRTPPDQSILYVQMSPDRTVREVYTLLERDLFNNGFMMFP